MNYQDEADSQKDYDVDMVDQQSSQNCYPVDGRGTMTCDSSEPQGFLSSDPGYYWIFWFFAAVLLWVTLGYLWRWFRREKSS